MELSPTGAAVLGVLRDYGGRCLATQLMTSNAFADPRWPTELPSEFRDRFNSIINIERGISECEELELVEFIREPVSSLKQLRLTEKARELMSEPEDIPF